MTIIVILDQVCGIICNTTLQYFAHAKDEGHQQVSHIFICSQARTLMNWHDHNLLKGIPNNKTVRLSCPQKMKTIFKTEGTTVYYTLLSHSLFC